MIYLSRLSRIHTIAGRYYTLWIATLYLRARKDIYVSIEWLRLISDIFTEVVEKLRVGECHWFISRYKSLIFHS